MPRPKEMKQFLFRAFEAPLSGVRVVLLGDAPYTDPDLYAGYGFGIQNSIATYDEWPAQLQKLAKAWADTSVALKNLKADEWKTFVDPDLDLIRWSGVLPIQVALTCTTNDRHAHLELWKPFTLSLLRSLHEQTPTLFYALGAIARNALLEAGISSARMLDSEHPQKAINENRPLEHRFKEMSELFKQTHGEGLAWALPF